MTFFPEMMLWKNSNLLDCQTWLWLFFFETGGTGYGQMGIGQIKMPQSSLFLWRFGCFSWIIIPQIAVSLWLISGILKKSWFWVFASVLFAFMERIFNDLWDFQWCPLSFSWTMTQNLKMLWNLEDVVYL